MKYPTNIESYRSTRSYNGYSQHWQIDTISGSLGLWRAQHQKAERPSFLQKAKNWFLLNFSPATLVREQLVTANANRLRVRAPQP